MKATELRIGNWVYLDDDGYGHSYKFQVDYIDKDFSSEALHPIPLTEQWLERFGFELYDYDVDEEIDVEEHETGIYKDYRLLVDGREYYYACHIHSDQTIQFTMKTTWADYVMLAQIQYVHQLQNLYFALQGVEL